MLEDDATWKDVICKSRKQLDTSSNEIKSFVTECESVKRDVGRTKGDEIVLSGTKRCDAKQTSM